MTAEQQATLVAESAAAIWGTEVRKHEAEVSRCRAMWDRAHADMARVQGELAALDGTGQEVGG